MNDQEEYRQFVAECDRIGLSPEARRYLGWDSTEFALAFLREMPTGMGEDEFYRQLVGTDFATFHAQMLREMGRDGDVT